MLTVLPDQVRPGDRITIRIDATHSSPAGLGYFAGGDTFLLPRPQHLAEIAGDAGDSPVLTLPAASTGLAASAHFSATVAADARPGDVIEWQAPTYTFDFVSQRIGPSPGGPPTSTSDVRHLVCSPTDPAQVLIRQTVVG